MGNTFDTFWYELTTNQRRTAFFNDAQVRLDASNLKAWFRGAQASELLGLAEQGLYFCRGALQLDPKELSSRS